MAKKQASSLWWDAKNLRWLVKYRGRSYSISCKGLREQGYVAEDGQRSSANAAKRWWEKRRQDIDAEQTTAHNAAHNARLESQGIGRAIEHAILQAARCRNLNDSNGADFWKSFAAGLASRTAPSEHLSEDLIFDSETGRFDVQAVAAVSSVASQARAQAHAILFEDMANAKLVAEKHSIPVLALEHTPTAEKPVTWSEALDRYLGRKRDRGLSKQREDDLRRSLKWFTGYVGSDSDVSKLTESNVSGYFDHVIMLAKRKDDPGRRGVWSNNYRKSLYERARQFVAWCHKQDYLTKLPKNLDELTLSQELRAVEIFTIEEVKHVLNHVEGRHRLYLLLMLNTGATQIDVANLKHSEIDLAAGRIVRRRSKTAKHQGAPTISYLLWEETAKLLREFRSDHAELALVNRDGVALRSDTLINGKYTKRDSIRAYFRKLAVRIELPANKTLKHFRKTGASLLADQFGERLAEHYLAHAGHTIAQKHYLQMDQAKFDAALSWLGRELGIISETT